MPSGTFPVIVQGDIVLFPLKHCPARSKITGQHPFFVIDIKYQRAPVINVLNDCSHYILYLFGTKNPVFRIGFLARICEFT